MESAVNPDALEEGAIGLDLITETLRLVGIIIEGTLIEAAVSKGGCLLVAECAQGNGGRAGKLAHAETVESMLSENFSEGLVAEVGVSAGDAVEEVLQSSLHVFSESLFLLFKIHTLVFTCAKWGLILMGDTRLGLFISNYLMLSERSF